MAPANPIQIPPASPQRQSTPPNSPAQTTSAQTYFEQLWKIWDMLNLARRVQTAPALTGASQLAGHKEESGDKGMLRARASKLEFKTVNEIWDKKAYKYTIVESVAPLGEVDELDEYVFVVRARIDRKTDDPTFYVDIKSQELRDILRTILRNINGVCLREDKPTVEQNLLYHYLPELEKYRCSADNSNPDNSTCLKHLDLLVDFIKTTYRSTTNRLIQLLETGVITYDLLWALFKPNTVVYTTCFGTGKPRCVKFDFGEGRTAGNGIEYFHLGCHYLDSDGKVFGEALIDLAILKFRGTKQIHCLDAFPLEYHQCRDEMKAQLIKCGRIFVSLSGAHHRQYQGNAFHMHQGQPIKLPVNGRIMIDAAYFREVNPNYTRPRINELAKQDISGGTWLVFETERSLRNQSARVKSNGMEPKEMTEDDLLLCSPTVPGWSFGNKQWAEFAVVDIKNIDWNPSSFARLALPPEKKEVIQALAEAHTSRASDHEFDDIIVGKGRGLIVLLHGPPGVGKTLTAEGMAEHLQRPLYAISAGELGTNVEALESQLSLIFQLASHWNAILLLDEADVFLEQRSPHDVHRNALVSVFLRTLEYYRGIMFLTTNRVKNIDDAITSRIHLPIKYNILSPMARRDIWESFLEKAVTVKGAANVSSKDIERLAQRDLNGRQIKNTVATAHALATQEGTRVATHQLEVAITATENFETDFKGAGPVGNRDSYL